MGIKANVSTEIRLLPTGVGNLLFQNDTCIRVIQPIIQTHCKTF